MEHVTGDFDPLIRKPFLFPEKQAYVTTFFKNPDTGFHDLETLVETSEFSRKLREGEVWVDVLARNPQNGILETRYIPGRASLGAQIKQRLVQPLEKLHREIEVAEAVESKAVWLDKMKVQNTLDNFLRYRTELQQRLQALNREELLAVTVKTQPVIWNEKLAVFYRKNALKPPVYQRSSWIHGRWDRTFERSDHKFILGALRDPTFEYDAKTINALFGLETEHAFSAEQEFNIFKRSLQAQGVTSAEDFFLRFQQEHPGLFTQANIGETVAQLEHYFVLEKAVRFRNGFRVQGWNLQGESVASLYAWTALKEGETLNAIQVFRNNLRNADLLTLNTSATQSLLAQQRALLGGGPRALEEYREATLLMLDSIAQRDFTVNPRDLLHIAEDDAQAITVLLGQRFQILARRMNTLNALELARAEVHQLEKASEIFQALQRKELLEKTQRALLKNAVQREAALNAFIQDTALEISLSDNEALVQLFERERAFYTLEAIDEKLTEISKTRSINDLLAEKPHGGDKVKLFELRDFQPVQLRRNTDQIIKNVVETRSRYRKVGEGFFATFEEVEQIKPTVVKDIPTLRKNVQGRYNYSELKGANVYKIKVQGGGQELHVLHYDRNFAFNTGESLTELGMVRGAGDALSLAGNIVGLYYVATSDCFDPIKEKRVTMRYLLFDIKVCIFKAFYGLDTLLDLHRRLIEWVVVKTYAEWRNYDSVLYGGTKEAKQRGINLRNAMLPLMREADRRSRVNAHYGSEAVGGRYTDDRRWWSRVNDDWSQSVDQYFEYMPASERRAQGPARVSLILDEYNDYTMGLPGIWDLLVHASILEMLSRSLTESDTQTLMLCCWVLYQALSDERHLPSVQKIRFWTEFARQPQLAIAEQDFMAVPNPFWRGKDTAIQSFFILEAQQLVGFETSAIPSDSAEGDLFQSAIFLRTKEIYKFLIFSQHPAVRIALFLLERDNALAVEPQYPTLPPDPDFFYDYSQRASQRRDEAARYYNVFMTYYLPMSLYYFLAPRHLWSLATQRTLDRYFTAESLSNETLHGLSELALEYTLNQIDQLRALSGQAQRELQQRARELTLQAQKPIIKTLQDFENQRRQKELEEESARLQREYEEQVAREGREAQALYFLREGGGFAAIANTFASLSKKEPPICVPLPSYTSFLRRRAELYQIQNGISPETALTHLQNYKSRGTTFWSNYT